MARTTPHDQTISEYDRTCFTEFSVFRERIDPYFTESTILCPYGLPHLACFSQASFNILTDRQMEVFLAAGYRRNGNCLYSMKCWGCTSCIPIRIRVADFAANRNQHRVWKRNADVDVKMEALQLDQEHLDLCDLFLQQRYPREHNRAQGYYGEFFCNTIADTLQVQYSVENRLVGASIIDLGRNFLNAVYFYFDPNESRRSLGTYNILTLISLCRQLDIAYLYLGYYIEEVSAMNYKNRFRPHQLLKDGHWREIR